MLIMNILVKHSSKPQGFFGKLVGIIMKRHNRESNEWTISLLKIKPTDYVLDIGFGPGYSIQLASKLVAKGLVAGIDFSDTMLKQASIINAEAIKAGKVELKQADASSIPYGDGRFDKAYAINVIYLWSDLPLILEEIKRVVKPGGQIALYLAPLELMRKLGFTASEFFTFYTADQVAQSLSATGFEDVRCETQVVSGAIGSCVLAQKSIK
jgi:ubiquinone/menaquinone biosynthesis C-methylase UbiE